MTGKKLGFVISHSFAGGAEKIWLDLADGFSRRGYAVTPIAFYPAGTMETAAELRWQHVLPSKPARPHHALRLAMRLVALFREQKFDYVFTALPAANALVPLAIRLAGVGTRVIRSHHSPVSTHSRAMDAIDSTTGSWSNVRATVSVSQTVHKSLAGKSNAYRSKATVIPNALAPDIEQELALLAPQYDRSSARSRTVVATGRLAPQKNYPVLIRAAGRVPKVRIRIIGSGPDETALRAQVGQLKLEENVEFVGAKPRNETLAMLAAGDIFAQPSLFEGHSLALIEAGKLGLPLVVSNVPVQIEAISDEIGQLCGMAVDPDDDAALADSIARLLDDPEVYRDYSERSKRLVRNITFTSMVSAYERLIDAP